MIVCSMFNSLCSLADPVCFVPECINEMKSFIVDTVTYNKFLNFLSFKKLKKLGTKRHLFYFCIPMLFNVAMYIQKQTTIPFLHRADFVIELVTGTRVAQFGL